MSEQEMLKQIEELKKLNAHKDLIISGYEKESAEAIEESESLLNRYFAKCDDCKSLWSENRELKLAFKLACEYWTATVPECAKQSEEFFVNQAKKQIMEEKK